MSPECETKHISQQLLRSEVIAFGEAALLFPFFPYHTAASAGHLVTLQMPLLFTNALRLWLWTVTVPPRASTSGKTTSEVYRRSTRVFFRAGGCKERVAEWLVLSGFVTSSEKRNIWCGIFNQKIIIQRWKKDHCDLFDYFGSCPLKKYWENMSNKKAINIPRILSSRPQARMLTEC